MGDVSILVATGKVTAAFRKDGGRWLCTALEYDLVGIGKTRTEAAEEMKQLVNAYVEHAAKSPTPVILENPSDPEEWKTEDKKRYFVVITVPKATPQRHSPNRLPHHGKAPARLPHVVEDFAALRRFRKRIRRVDLVPATV